MNITINHTKELFELSDILNIPIENIIEDVFTVLIKEGIIVDQDSAGDNVAELFTSTFSTSDEMSCDYVFGFNTPEIVGLFTKLVFWGVGDCPECGCESEPAEAKFMTQFDHNSQPEPKGYEYKVCTHCSYKF